MVRKLDKHKSFLLIALISLVILFGFHIVSGSDKKGLGEAEFAPGEPLVAVKIIDSAKEVRYANNAPFIIEGTSQEREKEEYFSISEIKIIKDGDGLSVYDGDAGIIIEGATHLYIREGESSGIASVNGDNYRGDIHIFPNKAGKTMKVINQLGMESYLKGVIPAEMGTRQFNELEALKAQAIAARTYALQKLQRSGHSGILESTILDMVYGGYDREYQLANEAIESTAGEVIMFNGNLIRAYFFSTCGGRTENIEDAWGEGPADYCVSIDDGDYCAWSKSYFWEDEFEIGLFRDRLNSYFKENDGKGIKGRIQDIKIITRSGSGRVNLLKVYTDEDQYELKGDKIRWAIRNSANVSKILPSTLFEMVLEYDDFGNIESVKFVGRGNGHGIGMCQCGAIGRARQGQSYREIVSAYYNGADIRRIY